MEFKFFTAADPTFPQRIPLSITWAKPLLNSFKLNTDGSFLRGSKQVGFGGVIRNSNGEWCMGYSGMCAAYAPANAELYALLKGLDLVVQNSYHPIEIEVDSLELLNSLDTCNPIFNPELSLCRSLLRRLGNLVLRHSFLEANGVAQFLCTK